MTKAQPPQEGSSRYSGTGCATSLREESCMLMWEAAQIMEDGLYEHSGNMRRLFELVRNLAKILENTRQLYNGAVNERDAIYRQLQEKDNRLLQVENVVRRYAATRDPVVASDGYTYEREALAKYLQECSSSNSKAYSLQTKEELTGVVVPNMSLIRFVSHLKSVRLPEIPQLTPRNLIAVVKSASRCVLSDEEPAPARSVDMGSAAPVTHPLPQQHQQSQQPAQHAIPNTGTLSSADRNRPVSINRFEHSAKKSNRSSAKRDLHPCLRVYGFCNFMEDCTFANYPFEACLNHIKGKCRFGQNCKELHVDPRDLRYENASSFASHHQYNNNSTASGANDMNRSSAAVGGTIALLGSEGVGGSAANILKDPPAAVASMAQSSDTRNETSRKDKTKVTGGAKSEGKVVELLKSFVSATTVASLAEVVCEKNAAEPAAQATAEENKDI